MRIPVLVGVGVGVIGLGFAVGADAQEQSYLDVASVSVPAKRMPGQMQMEIPTPTGLFGLPLAPEGLTDCEQAHFYRVQAGLPDIFDHLAFRESGCKNTAHTWCCFGIWQIHKLWIPQLALCDIYSIDDYFGDNPIDKQRNACAATIVLAKQGMHAWDTY